MSLLWRTAAALVDDSYQPWDEEHHEHALSPVFEAAGIKHSPCAYTRCHGWHEDYSNAFDKAEEKGYEHYEKGTSPPIERVSLKEPVHGFEPTSDRSQMLAYQHFPEKMQKTPPTWFRHEGKHYIMDGHHRTAAAMRRGDSHLDVHMIDLDKDAD